MKQRKVKAILETIYRCNVCKNTLHVKTNIPDKPHHAGVGYIAVEPERCLWCAQKARVESCRCRGCTGGSGAEILGFSEEEILQRVKEQLSTANAVAPEGRSEPEPGPAPDPQDPESDHSTDPSSRRDSESTPNE